MVKNGGADLHEITEDISYLRNTLTIAIADLSSSVNTLAQDVRAGTQGFNAAVLEFKAAVSALDKHAALWEKAMPVRVVMVVCMLIALAFGGNRILQIFEHISP